MKIKDKIKQINDGCENEIQKYLEYTQLGTILNLLEDGVKELRDEKIINLWTQIQEIIYNKRKHILELDVTKLSEKDEKI